VPVRQLEHSVAPTALAIFPAAQLPQAVDALTAEYLPTEHNEHAVEAAAAE